LRRASLTQLLLGIGYGGFWATLAPMLASVHALGPTVAGLIGIPGAAGILIARTAGRAMDRSGAGPVVATGIALVMGAFAVFALGQWWVAALALGAALLDCGLRAAMVANQTLVTSVDATARSRFNTVFAAHIWGGNALGAVLATTALTRAGWLAVCALAFASATLALLLQWLSVRRDRKRHDGPR
jgi:predicted MFS family arabinose efflux permease